MKEVNLSGIMTQTTPVVIGDCTLYLGDCREILPTLGKVDAVVTSPPYGQQRDYGMKITNWRELVSGAITRTPCGDKTQIFVNLGLIYHEGSVYRYWDDLISDMEISGYRLFGWYCWDQGDGLPGDWKGRLAPSHEFVFHFNKTAKQPNKTMPTKSRHRTITGTGLRKKNGETSEKMSHDGAQVNKEKIPDSVFRVYREMSREIDHPAKFPIGLPFKIIETYTNPQDVVIDPFMGSGTTGVACIKLGRKFIGIEIEPKYFDIACERIRKAYDQPDLFVAPPEKVKQEAML